MNSPEISTNIKDYKFFLPVRVHYGDTDSMQVVYYGAYLQFLEAGRQEYWRRMGIRLGELRERGFYLSIVESTCRYLQAAGYDDVLDVHVRTPEMRNSSFDVDYLIVRRNDEAIIAAARTIFVFMSGDEWKSCPIPDWFRTAVEQFEKR